MNPLQIKAYGESRLNRRKTDRADVALIARFAEQQSPLLWQLAPREICDLQRLLVRLEAVQGMSVQEQNRAHEAEGAARESVNTTCSNNGCHSRESGNDSTLSSF